MKNKNVFDDPKLDYEEFKKDSLSHDDVKKEFEELKEEFAELKRKIMARRKKRV